MLGLPFESRAAALGFDLAAAVIVVDEVWIAVRSAGSRAPRRDRGSKAVVSVALFGAVILAVQVAARWAGGTVPWPWLAYGVGATLVVAGLAIRVWAVLVLGRWFTTVVRVAQDQPVVTGGPYRWCAIRPTSAWSWSWPGWAQC